MRPRAGHVSSSGCLEAVDRRSSRPRGSSVAKDEDAGRGGRRMGIEEEKKSDGERGGPYTFWWVDGATGV